MKRINKLEIRCLLNCNCDEAADESVRARPDEKGNIWFGSEVWVDGVRLEPTHAVDISELARSIRPIRNTYRCDIFTCGCGTAACAAILDGIQVSHQGRYVFWSFRTPLAGAYVLRDAQQWLQNSSPSRLWFLRSQIADEIKNYFGFLSDLTGSDWSKCYIAPHSESVLELSEWSAIKEYL